MDDADLKSLAQRRDWVALETRSRTIVSAGPSKAADMALLRALLELGKADELSGAVATAIGTWPMATLRFLDQERDRIPDLHKRFAENRVIGNAIEWTLKRSSRSRWPGGSEIGTREAAGAYLAREVFGPAGLTLQRCAGREARILTFGSCFAQHLHAALLRRNISASTLSLDETINTTFANRDILQFLVDGIPNRTTQVVFGDVDTAEVARNQLVSFIRASTHLILTVGVAATFRDSKSGAVVAVPTAQEIASSETLSWQISGTAENVENLRACVALLRAAGCTANIILTLSPVPLARSFSPAGIVHDDLLSKSILRAAIGETLAEQPGELSYWPSFEAVKWVAPHASWAGFGADDGNTRHPSRWHQYVADKHGRTSGGGQAERLAEVICRVPIREVI